MRKGRPRLIHARRDSAGVSREHEERQRESYSLALARRTLDLARDGTPVKSHDGKLNAADALSGYTLGRLYLRHRADETDPSGISRDQYDAGQAWIPIVYAHARIMGYKLNIAAHSMEIGGGESCAPEPDEEYVLRMRRRWNDCYRELMEACRLHGGVAIRNVTYGVCIENWSIGKVAQYGFGNLKIGLNALARGLR